MTVPIRIVCATRKSEREFFEQTQTGKSLMAVKASSQAELALYADNSAGLGEVYNMAIDACRENPRILVFVHDDCLIADFFWADRVREGLAWFDVVGVAGNRRRLPRQPSWIIADPGGRQDDYSNLSGCIGQGLRFPPERLDFFGPSGAECKLLDGVFLAARSDVLHGRGLRFDPRFRFHFYDMDFCRTAERLNCRMGTIRLSLVHASMGSLDDAWRDGYRAYIAKWQD
jgi:hypothetical protein